MPVAPPKWCSVCRAQHEGRCERRLRETRRDYDQRRGSAAARGYDHIWQRASRAYLAAHPVCELCGNQLASLVDHIVPLRAGGARLDPENFQALDVQCHVVKTRRDMERWPEYRR